MCINSLQTFQCMIIDSFVDLNIVLEPLVDNRALIVRLMQEFLLLSGIFEWHCPVS